MTDSRRRVSRLQRAVFLLRFLPLFAAMRAADWLAPKLPLRWPRGGRSQRFAPGITIVVPERGTPDLLATTLSALAAACAEIDEPVQVVVVVNGADAQYYVGLRAAHPRFEWQFHERALGYNGAICAGLAAARHDWTYLLNSDMRLDRRALVELLPYRQPHVFAVTSQIFFEDATRRREETGWSDFHPHHDTPTVYEREPDPDCGLTRGNLYPGGGSSLCRTAVLRRYARESSEYQPFYWEDVDWGVRAWRDGFEVLFCPLSHAWHQHRGTVNRYYAADEIDRVMRRNAQWFDMRHAWTGLAPIEHIRRIAATEPRHWSEFSGRARALRTFRLRLAAHRLRLRGFRYEDITTGRYYGPAPATRHSDPARPRVLLVSPFALFPPAHGGARRIAELVSRLSDRVDFFLLGDERSLYTPDPTPWLRKVRATRLVEGRGDRIGEAPLTLAQRMRRHAWPALRSELERMITLYDPHVVQVEFMELALLAEQRSAVDHGDRRWLLALHDVYLRGDASDAGQVDTEQDDVEQIRAIARYDAVSACSHEDVELLTHPHSALIGNGAIDRRADYQPSPDSPRLLFMGPFRYAQNRDGILEFVERVWPDLRDRFPQLRLTILGGVESAAVVARDARLRQEGVEVVSAFVDPAPYLQQCALTINPQTGIRGSSIKLIESLLAGRVCVSTADGTRGFGADDLRGLVVAADIASMGDAIVPLLADATKRRALERADDAKLDRHTWDAIADRQLALYRQLASASRR